MALDDHPRPSVTADVVTFTLSDDNLQVLLVRRRDPPYEGAWAIPGGFVDIDEGLEEAALRELAEETGLQVVYIEQLHAFGDPRRDPRGRVITVAYLALARAPESPPRAGDDASQAKWWPADTLPPLAFDHDVIIACALMRLRHELAYAPVESAVVSALLPDGFTLSELQRAYEGVLGEKLKKRSFRRRILSANVIEDTGEVRTVAGRPAKLHRFRSDAMAETKDRRQFP